MISFNEFCSKVVAVISKDFDYEKDVRLEEFYKINQSYMGLVIRKKDENISPTINMNYLYSEYEKGLSFGEIINKIHMIHNSAKYDKDIDLQFLKDYDLVKDLIVFRLVNYEKNKEMLKGKPHRKFLGFAILYYYEFDMYEFEHCSVCVSNDHLRLWNISEDRLFELAMMNTPIIHEPYWFDLEDYIRSMMTSETISLMRLYGEYCRIYVITNKQKYYGASTILCSDALKCIAEEAGEDLYVIPSSVHEFLAIPKNFLPDDYDYEELIKSVNLEYLSPEEVLSNTLYYYDKEEENLKIYTKISSIG